MKSIKFNNDINEALILSKKNFNFKENFIENLKNNLKTKKRYLIIFIASIVSFSISPFFLQLLLLPTALVFGFKSFSNIVFKGIIDTNKEKTKFDKNKDNARRILESFKRKILVKNNIYVREDCYLKNIGTYSKKKVIENIRIKKEEKTINNYFRFKDREGQIYVLKQIKKEFLEDGISKEILSNDYKLLDLHEANIELKKEKGKIR